MSKRTLFSAAEVKRMAQLANDEGVTVEMERDGTTVRMMPFHPARTSRPKLSREAEGEGELAQWISDRERQHKTTGR